MLRLLVLALALDVTASAKKPEPPDAVAARACQRKTVRLTLDPSEPGASAKEDAQALAGELGGVVRTKGHQDGSRSLSWRRGERTPEECLALVKGLAERFPGRLRVVDPRLYPTALAVAMAGKRARGEVLKVQTQLQEPGAAPGTPPSTSHLAGLFDGWTGQAEAALAPAPVPGASPAASAASRAAAQWNDALAGSPAAGRYPSAIPPSFQTRSDPPPQPGAGAPGGNWTARAGRTVSEGVETLQRSAADAYNSAGRYANDGLAWARENLLQAPLAFFTRISSGFGERFHPIKKAWRHHSGVDYAAPYGTAVESAGDGVVESAGWNGGYGKCIIVRHVSGMETVYGHLSAVGVVRGQTVTRGRVIGRVGATGQATGPHLHYEVRRSGVAVDPLKVARL